MYETADLGVFAALMAMMAAYSFVIMILVIVSIIAMWKIFTKAGIEGWKSIIPIYSYYCLFKIASGNGWLFLIALIPVIGPFIALVLLGLKLAKAFGKDTGFAIGLILLPSIFQLLLGFGSAEYVGPANHAIEDEK